MNRLHPEGKADIETMEHEGRPDAVEAKPDDIARAAPMLGAAHTIQMSPEEMKLHRAVNLKMDIFVLPILSFLYLFSGLDRSNVGNAATVSFTSDIGIPATAVNNAVTLFFITFVIFQPISASVGKVVGITRWIPVIMFCWGIFTIAHAFVKTEGQLIAFRLMIGAFEAGFYPCATYYLSTCYCRYDLALRVAIFYGAYAIAGAFSSIIAYGILQITGALHSWQYLFLIEGVMTCGMSLFAWFWLPRHSSSAWFLKEEEKAWAAERMLRDSSGQDNTATGLTMTDLKEALKDWKFWGILPGNIAASVPGQAFSVFLPVIVKELGYSSYNANLFSVPIYVIGAVGLWTFAYSSDRFKERSIHILVALTFVIVGLVLVNQLSSASARYAALCILQIGSYTAPPLTVAWLANNTPSPGKRAIILGFNGWGNLAGVIGSQLFTPMYAPSYQVPFYVCLGINVYAFVNYGLYRTVLILINKRRARWVANASTDMLQAEDVGTKRLGDKKRTFVFST